MIERGSTKSRIVNRKPRVIRDYRDGSAWNLGIKTPQNHYAVSIHFITTPAVGESVEQIDTH